MDRLCTERSHWIASATRLAYNGVVSRRYRRKICTLILSFVPYLSLAHTTLSDIRPLCRRLFLVRSQLLYVDTHVDSWRFEGALATLVASYLARARGSNEPELSITRVKDLEQFIRECESFKLDHGTTTGNEHDQELENKRRRFEELLGNANG